MPALKLTGYLSIALVATYLVTNFIVTPILLKLGAPLVNIEIFRELVEGNFTNYLIFLIPISWGSAAIGEEMLCRGFLMYRMSSLSNDIVAIFMQAFFFALAHAYQGILGVANIFFLALVFGTVYVRCGRSLIPLILAHGIIDTISMTLLYMGRADLLTGTS